MSIEEAIKSEDDVETVVSALSNIAHSLDEEDDGGFGTKIAWIGTSLHRIAEALERISPPPAKP